MPGLTTENLFLASSDDFPHQKCLRTVHDLGSKLLEEMAALKIIIHISVNLARKFKVVCFLLKTFLSSAVSLFQFVMVNRKQLCV